MKVTYEEIKKANDSIKTTDIKGKDYAEVHQRIKAFRMVYPEGCIKTDMISNENGVCIFRAMIYSDSDISAGKLIATGTAYEKEGSTFINKTSYIENCETSAVGRALGLAGFGIDTSVASAEEVQNAIVNQAANEKIDQVQAKALEDRCNADGVDIDKLCKLYKVKTLSDLTMKKYMNIHENWDKISLKGVQIPKVERRKA